MLESKLPIGTIVAYAGQKTSLPPSNFKFCNGDKLPKKNFKELYNVLQDFWGSYSGTTQEFFALPDLRGMFLRGVNEDRNDEFKDPDVTLRNKTGNESNEVGSYQKDAFKKHSHIFKGKNTYDVHNSSATGGSFAEVQSTEHTESEGQSEFETRPKNAYVYYIIKVK